MSNIEIPLSIPDSKSGTNYTLNFAEIGGAI